MADNPSSRGKHQRGPLGFRIIGCLKLAGGLLGFAAWLGMFRLFRSNLADDLDWAIRHLRLDPENRVFHWLLDRVSRLDRNHLRAIEAGTFFYALLHVIEGIGLILERRWAGYLTIIATSSLIPFEVYEIIRKVNPLKILVLVVNIGFVIYLAYQLYREHQDRAGRRGAIAPGAEAADSRTSDDPS